MRSNRWRLFLILALLLLDGTFGHRTTHSDVESSRQPKNGHGSIEPTVNVGPPRQSANKDNGADTGQEGASQVECSHRPCNDRQTPISPALIKNESGGRRYQSEPCTAPPCVPQVFPATDTFPALTAGKHEPPMPQRGSAGGQHECKPPLCRRLQLIYPTRSTTTTKAPCTQEPCKRLPLVLPPGFINSFPSKRPDPFVKNVSEITDDECDRKKCTHPPCKPPRLGPSGISTDHSNAGATDAGGLLHTCDNPPCELRPLNPPVINNHRPGTTSGGSQQECKPPLCRRFELIYPTQPTTTTKAPCTQEPCKRLPLVLPPGFINGFTSKRPDPFIKNVSEITDDECDRKKCTHPPCKPPRLGPSGISTDHSNTGATANAGGLLHTCDNPPCELRPLNPPVINNHRPGTTSGGSQQECKPPLCRRFELTHPTQPTTTTKAPCTQEPCKRLPLVLPPGFINGFTSKRPAAGGILPGPPQSAGSDHITHGTKSPQFPCNRRPCIEQPFGIPVRGNHRECVQPPCHYTSAPVGPQTTAGPRVSVTSPVSAVDGDSEETPGAGRQHECRDPPCQRDEAPRKTVVVSSESD